jgi:hypothetical protein
MYGPIIMAFLKSSELINLKEEYKEVVGVEAPPFNCDDFLGLDDYVDQLKKSIETGIPWEWNGGEKHETI